MRQYSLPLLFAVLLHALAVAALQIGWEPERQLIREIKPQIVNAELVVLEPKAKPAPPAPKPVPKAPPKPAPEPVAQPKPEPAEPKVDPAIEQARQEQARREAQARAEAQAERERRLAELDTSALENALAEESAALADAAADDAEAAVASYKLGIYQQIVGNWSRPPSARNGMEATLSVALVPTGDVVDVTLLKSSGNTAFDQSAEAAVRKSRRFEVPKESALFEAHFRNFNLLFRPEDLLR
jgi:colicin import membrane protein